MRHYGICTRAKEAYRASVKRKQGPEGSHAIKELIIQMQYKLGVSVDVEDMKDAGSGPYVKIGTLTFSCDKNTDTYSGYELRVWDDVGHTRRITRLDELGDFLEDPRCLLP